MKTTILFILAFFSIFRVSSAQDSAHDYFNLGNDAYRKGDFSTAIEYFEKAIELDPSNTVYYYNCAISYRDNENFESALAYANKTIALEDTDISHYLLRGGIYSRKKDYNLAIKDYSYAIQLDPTKKEFYLNLGAMYEKTKQYTEALEAYHKAFALDNQYADAISGAERVTKILQDSPPPQSSKPKLFTAQDYTKTAKYSLDNGEYDEAIEQYTKALQINALYLEAYIGRSVAFFKNASYSAALKDINTYIEKKQVGISKWTWNLRGDIYDNLKRYDEAMTDYKTALAIDVDYIPTKNKIAALQKKMGMGVDNTPPKIIVTNPTSDIMGTPVRGLEVVKVEELITVTGKVEDDSGIDRILLNNKKCDLNFGTGNFEAFIKLTPGKNTLHFIAFDNKGNRADKIMEVNYVPNLGKSNANTAPAKPLRNLFGRNKALIIVTDKYVQHEKRKNWTNLDNPIRDGQAIGQKLNDNYLFEVEYLYNPTRAEIMEKLREYRYMNFNPQDQLLIFVAGHGKFDTLDNEGYIVPSDGRGDDDANTTSIPFTEFKMRVNNIPCHHILVMLDVCHGGTIDPFVKKRGETTLAQREEIAKLLEKKTRKYITSVGKGYASDGLPGQHSPFALDILTALDSKGGEDGILSIWELISFLKNTKTPDIEERPCYGVFDPEGKEGDFFLVAE
jgi:tetratricopeptide (TPR) repeat protein